jgi:hypothetical protein
MDSDIDTDSGIVYNNNNDNNKKLRVSTHACMRKKPPSALNSPVNNALGVTSGVQLFDDVDKEELLKLLDVIVMQFKERRAIGEQRLIKMRATEDRYEEEMCATEARNKEEMRATEERYKEEMCATEARNKKEMRATEERIKKEMRATEERNKKKRCDQ